jgi:hypothetical protein
MLAEAGLLSIAGGVLGIGIGWLGAQLLWASRPAFLTQSFIDVSPDWRICLFTAGLSAASCLLFGIAPVMRASIPDLSKLLNSAGRGNVEGGARSPLKRLLVVGEIALALIALVGAGLFLRSMQSAQNRNLGFETERLIMAGVNVGSLQMPPEKGRDFMRQLTAKVKAVPGVTSAAVADSAPLGFGLALTAFREGDPVDSRLGFLTPAKPVSPDYFDAIGVPLVEGRAFNDFDRMGTTHVAIVSEAVVQRMWPGQHALGKRCHFATSSVSAFRGPACQDGGSARSSDARSAGSGTNDELGTGVAESGYHAPGRGAGAVASTHGCGLVWDFRAPRDDARGHRRLWSDGLHGGAAHQ